MANRWYVIHVYSGFEKKVAASIREQAEQKGLSDVFEEILVPKFYVPLTTKGRICLTLGLHRDLVATLPEWLIDRLYSARMMWSRWRVRATRYSDPGREG